MNWRFVVTGGPGGGKSTLLDALAERGYRIAPEAARRLIKERLAAGCQWPFILTHLWPIKLTHPS
ncbi:MAG: hypothetical protein CMI02_15405 [Oceanospirillaceae bacterium]|nr:hypothetical protein [Oceanospirillaceae bacterium]